MLEFVLGLMLADLKIIGFSSQGLNFISSFSNLLDIMFHATKDAKPVAETLKNKRIDTFVVYGQIHK